MLRKLFLLVPFLLLVNVTSAVALLPCDEDYSGHCYGIYSFPGGHKYEGELKDGKPHGQGIYTFANGNRFEGEFRNGKYHGQGDFYFLADDELRGEKYAGEWRDGKRHGYGSYTYADGSHYLGEFKDDRPHGQGTLTRANGGKYVGEWEDGETNDQGTFTAEAEGFTVKLVGKFTKDGFVGIIQMSVSFEGEWVSSYVGTVNANNIPHGQGTWDKADGSGYVGEFRDGKRHGQGTYITSDGDKYVGQWRDGKRHGQGATTLLWDDGTEMATYVGEYRDNKFHGQGTYTFPNGDSYVGEFRDNKANGHGTLSYYHGDEYVGAVKDDKPNGFGTYFFDDGEVWVGLWEDDRFDRGNVYEAGNVPPEVYAATGREPPPSNRNEPPRQQAQGPDTDGTVPASLPPCPTDPNAYLHYCEGPYDFGDGNRYFGEWKDSNFHGQGTYTFANGDKYVGQFKDDVIHGHGTFTYFKNKKYVGEFKEGMKHGHGTLTYTHWTKYRGEIKDNSNLPPAAGTQYVGQFKRDAMSGHGTFTTPSGDKYTGGWKASRRYGSGFQIYYSGDVYIGEWDRNEWNGFGILFMESGDVVEGHWEGRGFQGGNKYRSGRVPAELAELHSKILSGDLDISGYQPKEFSRQQPQRPDPDEIIPAASGSGFVVSKSGHIVTNHHVIDGCNQVEVHQKGNRYRAIVVEIDIINDLAVLKANFSPTAIFSISSQNAELLQDVYVAGYPFGDAISTSVKVTKGIISSLSGIGNNYSNMQIDAALQPGNSGGPILDEAGNVVGVAVAKLDLKVALEVFEVVPEDTNFGIKSSVLKNFLDANGIETLKASTKSISRTELGKKITEGTLFLSCLMTYAQIEKLRAEKVMFTDLD